MRTCEVAVIGLGIMGSSALYNLCKRGVDALGFDPLVLGEKKGSSHGSCRIYRQYNFESEAYTKLGKHAFAAWSRLEKASGETVLLKSVLVEAGMPKSQLVKRSRAAAGRPLNGPPNGKHINKKVSGLGYRPILCPNGNRGGCSTAVAGGLGCVHPNRRHFACGQSVAPLSQMG